MPLNIEKIVEQVIKELEESNVVISTNTGDSSTATSDQKKQASMASAKGDTVIFKKKTDPIKESPEEDKVIPTKKDKDSVSMKVCEAIEEALGLLSPMAESEDKKAQRTSAKVMEYLNKAKTALEALTAHETQLSEKAEEENRKAEEKHIEAVKKLIKKKRSKDPALADKLTKDYDKVIRHLKDQDPEKVEEAIFGHFLKEAASK